MGSRVSRKQLSKYILQNMATDENVAREVAAVLIDSGQTSELESLMRDVNELSASQNGIVELTARSAFAIDSSVKAEIETVAQRLYPNVKKLVIHEVMDASVIGGVNLTFANASLDLTIKHKLHKLRDAAN